MGCRRMIRSLVIAWLLACGGGNAAEPPAESFKHVGDFLLQAHFKLTGDQLTPIPIKPLALRVYTDGVLIRVTAEGDEQSHTTFQIYRSDGIGRQRNTRSALEVIPGLQATSQTGGILRHLRLSRETLTITTFPGVSDQTIVSHAVAAEPKPPPSPPTPDPTRPSQP